MEKLIQFQKEVEDLRNKRIKAVQAQNFKEAENLRIKEIELRIELEKVQMVENNGSGD